MRTDADAVLLVVHAAGSGQPGWHRVISTAALVGAGEVSASQPAHARTTDGRLRITPPSGAAVCVGEHDDPGPVRGYLGVREAIYVATTVGAIASVLRAVRSADDGGDVRSTLAALIGSPAHPMALIGLGPARVAPLIPCWPALTPPHEVSADGDEPPPVARIGGVVDAALRAGHLDPLRVERTVDDIQEACLEEAFAAERQASIMDRDGDDAGGMVRRLVATLHGADLTLSALGALLAR